MSKPKTKRQNHKRGPVGSSELVVPLSSREIVSQLRVEVRMYKESFRDRDGQIRNEGALRTIAALRAAIGIVKRHNKY